MRKGQGTEWNSYFKKVDKVLLERSWRWKSRLIIYILIVSFPSKRGIGEVVGIFQSIVARELLREFPSLKRRLWDGELWEGEYFVRTVVGSRMER